MNESYNLLLVASMINLIRLLDTFLEAVLEGGPLVAEFGFEDLNLIRIQSFCVLHILFGFEIVCLKIFHLSNSTNVEQKRGSGFIQGNIAGKKKCFQVVIHWIFCYQTEDGNS